jgi:hypothetical protein
MKYITVTYSEFDTEDGYDFVTISSCSDASCAYKTQIDRRSGGYSSTITFTTPTTGFILVEFTSDVSVMRNGFTLSWASGNVSAVSSVHQLMFSLGLPLQYTALLLII